MLLLLFKRDQWGKKFPLPESLVPRWTPPWTSEYNTASSHFFVARNAIV